MTAFVFPYTGTAFRAGEVVVLARDLIGVPAPDGGIVRAEKLGPGLVKQVTPEGAVCVCWVSADLEVCLPHEDLRSPGSDAHLVTVKQYNSRSICTAIHYRIAAGLGFTHNWTVETRFPNIIRTLRDDGYAWTFTYDSVWPWLDSSVFRRNIYKIDAQWEVPRDEDDAEALTVADLMLSN